VQRALSAAIFLGPLYTVGAVLALTLFPTGIGFTALALPLNIGTALADRHPLGRHVGPPQAERID
jgi:hypothetical protein